MRGCLDHTHSVVVLAAGPENVDGVVFEPVLDPPGEELGIALRLRAVVIQPSLSVMSFRSHSVDISRQSSTTLGVIWCHLVAQYLHGGAVIGVPKSQSLERDCAPAMRGWGWGFGGCYRARQVFFGGRP